MTAATVLAQVLRKHGNSCHCEGACGRQHRCYADGTPKAPLVAAPFPVIPPTDHEAAAVPVDQMRPWCPSCWRLARKRAREQDAERRRVELEEAQIGFDIDTLR